MVLPDVKVLHRRRARLFVVVTHGSDCLLGSNDLEREREKDRLSLLMSGRDDLLPQRTSICPLTGQTSTSTHGETADPFGSVYQLQFEPRPILNHAILTGGLPIVNKTSSAAGVDR